MKIGGRSGRSAISLVSREFRRRIGVTHQGSICEMPLYLDSPLGYCGIHISIDAKRHLRPLAMVCTSDILFRYDVFAIYILIWFGVSYMWVSNFYHISSSGAKWSRRKCSNLSRPCAISARSRMVILTSGWSPAWSWGF